MRRADRLFQLLFLPMNDRQSKMSNHIVRIRAQDAVENVGGRFVGALLQQRLGQHTIRFDVLGILPQYVPAVLRHFAVAALI